ncbi:MAG: SUF system Fe-S cluster assembly regulator [Alphaproteobacteria bacterium]
MFRLSKLADYGIVIMTNLARRPDRQVSAADIASDSLIPQPTVSKVLKMLARADLLISHRGAKGGYGLSRPGSAITVAEVITAIEGPIALTACIEDSGACDIERLCPARANWQRINDAIRDALDGITIEEMALAIPEAFAAPIGTDMTVDKQPADRVEAG